MPSPVVIGVVFCILTLALLLVYRNYKKEMFYTPVSLFLDEPKFQRIGPPLPDYRSYNQISITDDFIHKEQAIYAVEAFLSLYYKSPVKVVLNQLRYINWKDEDMVFDTSIVVDQDKVYDVRIHAQLLKDSSMRIITVDSIQPNVKFHVKAKTGPDTDIGTYGTINKTFTIPVLNRQ